MFLLANQGKGDAVSIGFNVDEIFQMAEQIERNGAYFYKKAASGAEPQTAQVLLQLSAMEEEHEKTFTRMRAELSEKERNAMVPDPENQAAAYLRAWTDGQVFNVRSNPAERLTGREKAEDIWRIAIGLEKDSIVFYLGMKDAVPERLGRDKIDRIIKEEMVHIAILSGKLETLRHQSL